MTEADSRRSSAKSSSATPPWRRPWGDLSAPAAAGWTAGALTKALGGLVLSLYVLNQARLLPLPVSRVVSKVLFWPTLPITVAKRWGSWTTVIDETVVMGGAPFGFLGLPDRLYEEYGVRGVVNFCEEYQGPQTAYRRLGIQQLRLPTADHFEPTVSDYVALVRFVQKYQTTGDRVYIHCRAGHGRSAAGVLAWLLAKGDGDDGNPNIHRKHRPHPANRDDPQRLNQDLCRLRNVRRTLWRQPNLQRFYTERVLHSDTCSDLDPVPGNPKKED